MTDIEEVKRLHKLAIEELSVLIDDILFEEDAKEAGYFACTECY